MTEVYICALIFAVMTAAPFAAGFLASARQSRETIAIPENSSDLPRMKRAEFEKAVLSETPPGHLEYERFEGAAGGDYTELPIVASGEARFGRDAKVGELYAGEIFLSEDCRVLGNIDAEKYLSVKSGCHIGTSAECGGIADVGERCEFADLYAVQLRFAGGAGERRIGAGYASGAAQQTVRDIKEVDERQVLLSGIITKHKLHIKSEAVVSGDVSSRRDITLGDGVTVCGNLMAWGSIRTGERCTILGNVFAQEEVVLGGRTVVGEEGRIKSVVAGSALTVQSGCTVYGRARAKRGGRVGQDDSEKNAV